MISPEYSLKEFCQRMIGRDPAKIIDATSAEITYASFDYNGSMKRRDFRKGSKRRLYCENLQQLLLLVTGTLPTDASTEFLQTARPLMLDLLQKWEIGDLRRFFVNMPEPMLSGLLDSCDFLSVVVSRDDVEAGDISSTVNVLQRLIESPATARRFFGSVDIAFDGYNDFVAELFEIPEVRTFVYKLDERFPFWLFFLSKHHLGLQCLLFCLLPASLTDQARAEVFPERIDDLLTRRWFPAMNHICDYAGFSERQIKELTDVVLTYIASGRPLPLTGSTNPITA